MRALPPKPIATGPFRDLASPCAGPQSADRRVTCCRTGRRRLCGRASADVQATRHRAARRQKNMRGRRPRVGRLREQHTPWEELSRAGRRSRTIIPTVGGCACDAALIPVTHAAHRTRRRRRPSLCQAPPPTVFASERRLPRHAPPKRQRCAWMRSHPRRKLVRRCTQGGRRPRRATLFRSRNGALV